MATAHHTLPSDAPTDHLPENLPEVPDGWRMITDRESLKHGERTAWVHVDTQLRVSVRSDRRPTQMHTPETSTDDTGFVAHVRGEFGGQLTYDLAAKTIAYQRAIEFMAAYPVGDFEVPDPSETMRWGSEPLDWRPDDV